ncbi:MAG: glycosyltransferase family 4 protein [Steroidobacteraceae bacterium]
MRILISAYACEPHKGSEPGIGWNWVREIARFNEVWVITRENNRPAIEAAARADGLGNVHWNFFDLPRWSRFWKKGHRGVHLYYYLWQLAGHSVARRLASQVKFDLAHHVTFGQYWMPSLIARLGIPFILGPLGGGESAPTSFTRAMEWPGWGFERTRELVRGSAELNPRVRSAIRRAALCLASTAQTADRLRDLGCRRVRIHSCCGLPEEDIAALAAVPQRHSAPFRMFSGGALYGWKGFHLGLLAFARFQASGPPGEYWIFGDGPQRRPLEKQAQQLGVADRVRFLGAVPRARLLDELASCDLLVHPSLHDSGGWICAEAMAAGRPVICLDLGGPALQVTEETGIKIAADDPQRAVASIAEAMRTLALNPELRIAMGETARRRIRDEFAWRRKGEALAGFYREAVAQ